MPIDRLIRLAQKTGDRLIVHNPIDGHDVVIMGIEEYERLVDAEQDGELLRSLEHDLDVLHDEFEAHHGEFHADSEFEEEEFEAPQFEIEDPSPWQSTGEVLGEQYASTQSWDEDSGLMTPASTSATDDWDSTPVTPFTPPVVAASSSDEADWDVSTSAAPEYIPSGQLEHDMGMRFQMPQSNDPVSPDWEEEPLGEEESVFYEEPV